MASITVTIPDAVLPRVLAAFAATYNYDPNADPPQTQGQFTKAQVIAYIKTIVRQYEAQAAARQASATAAAQADADLALS